MSRFYSWLNEATLQTNDLAKDIEGYDNRGQVLLKKLESGEALALSDGTKEVLYASQEDIETLRSMVDNNNFKGFPNKVKLYKKSTGEEVKLSHIEKTKEFGSSGGIGGGTKQTAIAESAAAVTAAHYIKNGFTSSEEYKNYLESLSPANMKREFSQISNNYEITNKIDEVSKFLLSVREWLISSCSTAMAIENELDLPSDFVIHRGSKTMDSIYKKAQKLMKEVGLEIPNDKWNPADVWIISKGSQRYQRLMDASTIQEFNGILADSIRSKDYDVVGVSLKKASSKYPPVKWYNLEKHNIGDINIEGIKPGFFVKIPISKNMVIFDTDPEIKLDVRTFQTAIKSKVGGELLGKKARGGKVAGKAMKSFIKSHEGGIKFGDYDRNNVLNKSGDWFSEDFIYKFYQRIQQLKRSEFIDKSELRKIKSKQDVEKILKNMYNNEFKGKLNTLAANMASKIQAMEIAIYATDEFFEFTYSYASSSIKGVSGPFIKIGK